MTDHYEYTNGYIVDLINERVHNERNRKLMIRRLCDGIIFEDLAEEFELSVRQTKRIVYRESEKIFNHLGG